MPRLFAYGSLRCPDIMHRVAGLCDRLGPATLDGYRCMRVRDEEYPAIVQCVAHTTDGLVYENVSIPALARLDDFEGEMYSRTKVTVRLESGLEIETFTYIIQPEFHHCLTDDDWQFERFLAHGKDRFVARYVGFSTL